MTEIIANAHAIVITPMMASAAITVSNTTCRLVPSSAATLSSASGHARKVWLATSAREMDECSGADGVVIVDARIDRVRVSIAFVDVAASCAGL